MYNYVCTNYELRIPQFYILEDHKIMQLKGKNRVDSWAQTKYLNQAHLNSFSPGTKLPNQFSYPNHYF